MAIIPADNAIAGLAEQGAIANAPKITVIAAGGAGINLVYSLRDSLTKLASVLYFDLSEANKIDKLIPPESFRLIGNGRGSGADRAENLDRVIQAMPNFTDAQLGYADINIIVFSGAGGSGSVTGPALMREIHNRARVARRKTRTVVVMIADLDSHTAAKNTLGTLRTLQSFVDDDQLYVPLLVVTNEYGRRVADVTATHRLSALVQLLGLPTLEADFNDRMNFLDCSAMRTGAAPGLHLLHIVNGVKTDEAAGPGQGPRFRADDVERSGQVWDYPDSRVVDSILALGLRSPDGVISYVDSDLRARVKFTGIFATQQLVPMLGMISTDDSGVRELITKIASIDAQFTAMPERRGSTIDMGQAKPTKGGFVI